MTGLYPLKFKPILKKRLWGDNSLASKYNKEADPAEKTGESWEISAVQGDLSVVSNGFLEGNNIEEIIEVYMGDLLGEEIYEKFGNEFPLLIKLIDAKDTLSVQVHPDNALARGRHNAYGKTEMWYILEAGEESVIYNGFSRNTSNEEFFSGKYNPAELMNTIKPEPGDSFFIPAGRIHAIGGGVLLAEIQQTSDVTYRVYDWDRVDENGKARELHTDLAADAIDYRRCDETVIRVEPENNDSVVLVECEFFTTNLITLNGRIEKDYSGFDRFIIYLCTEGSVEINYTTGGIALEKGETLLLPATTGAISIKGDPASLLEVYINNH